jgi:DNA ligase (NAD+)
VSIVISGVFSHHSRDEYKLLIEQHGGKNIGSISAKTSFILAGDNMGPAKLQKAERLGIRIVSEDEFLEMINGVSVPVNVPVPVESPSKGDAPIQLSLF